MATQQAVEEVYYDYCGRRRGILKALTQEVDKFYSLCDPNAENLCLYGYADETYQVALPCEEVPPELPEPTLGINFARDGMNRQEWLSLVAVHSDSWLIAMAFYNGARLDHEGRRLLFNQINTMPTCFEVVSGQASQGDPAHIAKRALGAAPPGLDAAKRIKAEASRPWPGPRSGQEEEMGSSEEEGDEGEAEWDPCPNCHRQYRSGEFWIQCDACDRWFDGRCVGMSQFKAERQREWRCPFCVKGA